MAEKVFKINEEIEIVYQAPNKESGLTGLTAVEARIYLPDDTEDSNFPLQDLVEIGGSGIYKGKFTPDQQGEWKVTIYKSADGDGQVVKRYSVGAHNVHSVGDAVGTLDDKIETVDGVVDGIVTNVADLDGDVATLDGKVVDLAGDVVNLDSKVDFRVNTTDGKIDALDTKVSSLDTPPMVS